MTCDAAAYRQRLFRCSSTPEKAAADAAEQVRQAHAERDATAAAAQETRTQAAAQVAEADWRATRAEAEVERQHEEVAQVRADAARQFDTLTAAHAA